MNGTHATLLVDTEAERDAYLHALQDARSRIDTMAVQMTETELMHLAEIERAQTQIQASGLATLRESAALQELRKECDTVLMGIHQDYRHVSDARDHLEMRLEVSDARAEQAESDLAASRSRNQVVEQQLQENGSALTSLRAQNNQLRLQVQGLELRQRVAIGDVERLRGSLQRSITVLEAARDVLQAENADLQETSTDLQADNDRQIALVAGLRLELDAARGLRERLAIAERASGEAVRQAATTRLYAQRTHAKLLLDYGAVRQQLQIAQQQLQVAQQQLQVAPQQRKADRLAVATLQRDRDRAVETRILLEIQAQVNTGTISDLQRQVVSLQAEAANVVATDFPAQVATMLDKIASVCSSLTSISFVRDSLCNLTCETVAQSLEVAGMSARALALCMQCAVQTKNNDLLQSLGRINEFTATRNTRASVSSSNNLSTLASHLATTLSLLPGTRAFASKGELVRIIRRALVAEDGEWEKTQHLVTILEAVCELIDRNELPAVPSSVHDVIRQRYILISAARQALASSEAPEDKVFCVWMGQRLVLTEARVTKLAPLFDVWLERNEVHGDQVENDPDQASGLV